jgi:3-hydroxyisobutyrate dehydrogenase-like beta-hydroxyacid dehydrogenase
MKQLKRQGHSLWIYTTSYRSPKQVKRWFKFYGVEIDAVINQDSHERLVGRDRFNKYVSKYPPAFDIDLHVDDLEGVRLEGEEHGFKVVIVSMTDEAWAQRVLEAVQKISLS